MEVDQAATLLRTSRLRAGLNQRDLFKASGVAQSTISQIESGRAQPTLPTLSKLIEACRAKLMIETTPQDGRWSAVEAADVAKRWNTKGDEDSAIRAGLQLRDDLAKAASFRLSELVADEPTVIGNPKLDALMAAVVDEACGHQRIDAPGWVRTPARVLSNLVPLWSMSPQRQARAMLATPQVFLEHGLIASARDLASV